MAVTNSVGSRRSAADSVLTDLDDRRLPPRRDEPVSGPFVDRWIALLAGQQVWADGEEVPTVVTRLSAGFEAGALMCAVGAMWAYRWANGEAPVRSWLIREAPIAFSVACAILAIGSLRIARGRPTPYRGFASQILLRLSMLLVIVAATFAALPTWWPLVIWPFGVALGGDAAITSWAIGWYTTPLRSYTAYLRSPIHLGLLGGLFGVFASRGWHIGEHAALPIYVTFQVWVLVATLTASWLGLLRRRERRDLYMAARSAASDEHRRAAHWLHDDICADLRLVAIRVQDQHPGLTEVTEMLDDLDHRLRLRQLEELLESGSVRLAEVLQPYVRRAQNHATIGVVPTFDEASLIVDGRTGRLFGRAASVLTSNALNAGATLVSFAISSTQRDVSIAVTDNAGGFPTKDLPYGRGLWSLQADPQVRSVAITDCPGGSQVRVTIDLERQDRRAAALAR
jgi:hypothetical protein